jgi:ATP-dependent Zn protease
MDTAVAGRVAEEIVFGLDNVQTGATADFQQLVHLARNYVLRYGMSDKVRSLQLSSGTDLS